MQGQTVDQLLQVGPVVLGVPSSWHRGADRRDLIVVAPQHQGRGVGVHAVAVRPGALGEEPAYHCGQQVVGAVGVDVIQRGREPVVGEGRGVAALAQDHVGVHRLQPAVHVVQRHPPMQDVLDHQRHALGIADPVPRVGRQLLAQHRVDPDGADRVPNQRQVAEHGSAVLGGICDDGHGRLQGWNTERFRAP